MNTITKPQANDLPTLERLRDQLDAKLKQRSDILSQKELIAKEAGDDFMARRCSAQWWAVADCRAEVCMMMHELILEAIDIAYSGSCERPPASYSRSQGPRPIHSTGESHDHPPRRRQ